MDHRGLRARLTGAGCTSCGAAVPVDRIAVLADRGDFAFVELHCGACGSRTMGLVLASPDDAPPVLDTAVDAGPDLVPPSRPVSREPVSEEDVLAMRQLLDGWSGDLRTLLGDAGSPDGGSPA